MDDGHEGLNYFRKPDKVQNIPLLKDLYQHITPQYAADWKVIGTLLGLPSGRLQAIEAGWPTNVKWCCNQMLEKWLQVDRTASWSKLFTVIESSAVSCSADKATLLTSKLNQLTITDKRAEAVTILSNRMSQITVQTRFMVDDDTWPPKQPKIFTPLLFIHHQGDHTPEQATAVAELMYAGDIDKVASVTDAQCAKLGDHEKFHKLLDTSKATKEIGDILAPLEKGKQSCFILIEGAPGIGKSVLLKEITYKWAKKNYYKNLN